MRGAFSVQSCSKAPASLVYHILLFRRIPARRVQPGIDELPQPIHSRNRVRKPSCRWPCSSRGRPMPAGPRAAPAAA